MSELLRVLTHSCEETEKFAEHWAQSLTGGDVVLLSGDLGAGKTHFTKGIARALNIDDVITSPTFALHNVYYGKLVLNHFDFYRVDSSEEVEILGLNEFFFEKDGVCAIEWWQNVADLLPKKCFLVTISKLSDEDREILIEQR